MEGIIIKKLNLFFVSTILLTSLFGLVIPNKVSAKTYPKGDYKNAIVLEGYTSYNKTAAIFQFNRNSNSSLSITADYGDSKGSSLDNKVHEKYSNDTYYEAALIGKSGQIKNHVVAKGSSPKREALDSWNKQDTNAEVGDIFGIYTLETAKSYWFDKNGGEGNLPPDFMLGYNENGSPNGSKNKSRSTLYYVVTNYGFERIKLENISTVNIYEGESISPQIEKFFKEKYNLTVDIDSDLGDKNLHSGTYRNVKLNTNNGALQSVFDIIYADDNDSNDDDGITVNVYKKGTNIPDPEPPTPEPEEPERFNLITPDELKFRDYKLGTDSNTIKLLTPLYVQIEDNKQKGWILSLSVDGDNTLAKNLIFKTGNTTNHLYQSPFTIQSGKGDYNISLQDHLFVNVPNARSFLAQNYETQLTWNLASAPQ